MTVPPWSYSMLEMFDNCPKQAFHQYMLKEKGPKTPQMAEGIRLDTAIESRIMNGEVLPPEFSQYEPMAMAIGQMCTGNNKVITQAKFGIDRQFKPVPFFDANVWGRGALDLLMYNPPNGIILDWKTGKNNENSPWSNGGLQLKIFAAMAFKHFPRIEKLTAFNIWLKTNQIGKVYTWTREQERQLWLEILPRVMRLEAALLASADAMKPGPLCGWCNVKSCPNNKS